MRRWPHGSPPRGAAPPGPRGAAAGAARGAGAGAARRAAAEGARRAACRVVRRAAYRPPAAHRPNGRVAASEPALGWASDGVATRSAGRGTLEFAGHGGVATRGPRGPRRAEQPSSLQRSAASGRRALPAAPPPAACHAAASGVAARRGAARPALPCGPLRHRRRRPRWPASPPADPPLAVRVSGARSPADLPPRTRRHAPPRSGHVAGRRPETAPAPGAKVSPEASCSRASAGQRRAPSLTPALTPCAQLGVRNVMISGNSRIPINYRASPMTTVATPGRRRRAGAHEDHRDHGVRNDGTRRAHRRATAGASSNTAPRPHRHAPSLPRPPGGPRRATSRCTVATRTAAMAPIRSATSIYGRRRDGDGPAQGRPGGAGRPGDGPRLATSSCGPGQDRSGSARSAGSAGSGRTSDDERGRA